MEELFLGVLQGSCFGAIKCLVTGCIKLKILHVERGVTLESVQHVLLGLPNLIEFKYPLMVVALEKIIQDGRADNVSALRNLYIGANSLSTFGVRDVLKSAQMVLSHLNNIRIVDITIPSAPRLESLTNFYATVSGMTQLTELTCLGLVNNDHTIIPMIKATGHQLKLLDLNCENCPSLDVIDQCRELRVLRITVLGLDLSSMNDQSYGSDLDEEFTPFKHLRELYLYGVNRSHFKPTLFKSLVASPLLQDLTLQWLPIFTDDIVEATFFHINEDEEQLAFTSLRKLELYVCNAITNYLEGLVTHERVPLEFLTIIKCPLVTMKDFWNLQRFDLEFRQQYASNQNRKWHSAVRSQIVHSI